MSFSQAFDNSSLSEENGSALLAVLVIVVVSTLLIGSVMALLAAQDRFVRRDVHRSRAFYAAEAGLESAISSLDRYPLRRGNLAEIFLPDSSVASARIVSHGALIRIESTGTAGREVRRISALIGQKPTGPFESAVWIGEPSGGLNVAGTTYISGPIVVGESGIRKSAFRQTQFRGKLDGTVVSTDSVRMPQFRDGFLRGTAHWADSLISSRENSGRADPLMNGIESTNEAMHVFGQTVNLDETMFAERDILVVHASASLSVVAELPAGSQLIVQDSLYLAGKIRGQDLVFYAKAGIHFSDGFEGTGQFLTHGPITVGRDVWLHYPSVLYTSADTPAATVFDTADGAKIEGTVIVGVDRTSASTLKDPVHLSSGATLLGALYSEKPSHIAGQIMGSLVVPSLRFYESPTVYVNWLVDSYIDISKRPEPYATPPGFSDLPRHMVISRRTLADEPGTE